MLKCLSFEFKFSSFDLNDSSIGFKILSNEFKYSGVMVFRNHWNHPKIFESHYCNSDIY